MLSKPPSRLKRILGFKTKKEVPRQLRVLIGLTEIAGVNAGLSKGFRDLGHHVTSVVLDRHPFGYETAEFDSLPKTLGLAIQVRAFARKAGRLPKARRAFCGAADKFLRALAFPSLIRKHDVFVFIFGAVVIGRWEGAIVRLFRRSYIQILLGSDARPPFLDAYYVSEKSLASPGPLLKRSRRMRRQLSVLSRCSTAIVALPEFGHYLTRPYVDLMWLGLPIVPVHGVARPSITNRESFRILHSPSHEKMKGTAIIRASIERLQKIRPEVEYRELKGVPNSVVREALQETDLLVDQLYSDTPSPALATEASSLGVPTLLGTLHHSILSQSGNFGYPATMTIDPDELDRTLDRLVENRNSLPLTGQMAKKFVDEHWNPISVASRILEIANNSTEVRVHSPGNCPLGGAGLSRRELIASLSVVTENGWESLVFPDQTSPMINTARFLAELRDRQCDANDTKTSIQMERL
jgi:hypothetical protein